MPPLLPCLQLWSVKDTKPSPWEPAGYFRSGSNTTPAALTDLLPPQRVGCRPFPFPAQAGLLPATFQQRNYAVRKIQLLRGWDFSEYLLHSAAQGQQQTAFAKCAGCSPCHTDTGRFPWQQPASTSYYLKFSELSGFISKPI